jgi:hypothetical protein
LAVAKPGVGANDGANTRLNGNHVKSIVAFFLALVIAMAVVDAAAPLASETDGSEVAPVFGVRIPPGYRNWRLVSVAREDGNLNDLRRILGNDLAINAYREGEIPFPDGTILVRLAWQSVSSEENNKVFGRPQSFVAGAPTNLQVMVKGSAKYASTGGWGFAQFTNGKPDGKAVQTSCSSCHNPDNTRDSVFTRYSP